MDTRRYGVLIPNPIKRKITKRIIDFCVKAIVIAVPTNGAVQGVANIVAKNPLKKFFVKKLFPELKYFDSLIKFGNSISNKPIVFKKNKDKINKIKIKKYCS